MWTASRFCTRFLNPASLLRALVNLLVSKKSEELPQNISLKFCADTVPTVQCTHTVGALSQRLHLCGLPSYNIIKNTQDIRPPRAICQTYGLQSLSCGFTEAHVSSQTPDLDFCCT